MTTLKRFFLVLLSAAAFAIFTFGFGNVFAFAQTDTITVFVYEDETLTSLAATWPVPLGYAFCEADGFLQDLPASIVVPEGHSFEKYLREGGADFAYGEELWEDVKIYPSFARFVYTVEYFAAHGSSQPFAVRNVLWGDAAELVAPPVLPSRNFLFWTQSEIEQDAAEYDFLTPVYSDLRLFAVHEFTPTRRITVFLDGTEIGEFDEGEIIEAVLDGLVAHTEGKRFEGFYFDAAFLRQFDGFVQSEGDTLQLFAKYTDSVFEVTVMPFCVEYEQSAGGTRTFCYDGELFVVAANGFLTVLEGGEGFAFAGYFLDAQFEAEYSLAPVTESLTLYPRFVREVYTVSFWLAEGELWERHSVLFGDIPPTPDAAALGDGYLEFFGWHTEVGEARGDADYFAIFVEYADFTYIIDGREEILRRRADSPAELDAPPEIPHKYYVGLHVVDEAERIFELVYAARTYRVSVVFTQNLWVEIEGGFEFDNIIVISVWESAGFLVKDVLVSGPFGSAEVFVDEEAGESSYLRDEARLFYFVMPAHDVTVFVTEKPNEWYSPPQTEDDLSNNATWVWWSVFIAGIGISVLVIMRGKRPPSKGVRADDD